MLESLFNMVVVSEGSSSTLLNVDMPISVSFFEFKLNQILFGLVKNLKNQSHLFVV
jgi:hypothetical protein